MEYTRSMTDDPVLVSDSAASSSSPSSGGEVSAPDISSSAPISPSSDSSPNIASEVQVPAKGDTSPEAIPPASGTPEASSVPSQPEEQIQPTGALSLPSTQQAETLENEVSIPNESEDKKPDSPEPITSGAAEEGVISESMSPQISPSADTTSASGISSELGSNEAKEAPAQVNIEPQDKPAVEAVSPQPVANPLASEQVNQPSIPSLHYPFYGSYPSTFDFGALSSSEDINSRFRQWGITGHDGIDFALSVGTDVLSCDEGKVIQAGDNGDFGISITIQHSWGTSIYGHLQSLGVLVGDSVAKGQVIGASGQTGYTTGPHLHFGMKPNNPDVSNGYHGYINPSSYLSEHSEKPETQEVPLPVPDISQPSLSQQDSPPVETSVKEVVEPSHTQEDIETKVEAMFDARQKENSMKGNEAKKAKREASLQKIFSFAQEKKRITNEQVRDLLHVSQSTASDYLSDLVGRGMLKTEGKGKATVYLF